MSDGFNLIEEIQENGKKIFLILRPQLFDYKIVKEKSLFNYINNYKPMNADELMEFDPKKKNSSPRENYKRPRALSFSLEFKNKALTPKMDEKKKTSSLDVGHSARSIGVPRHDISPRFVLYSPRSKNEIHTSREILSKVKHNTIFRSDFEESLTKNQSLSNWKFWEDVTFLLEHKIDDNEFTLKFLSILQKYLLDDSANQVKKFLFF